MTKEKKQIQAGPIPSRSEMNCKELIENAVVGVFQTTPEGRYVSANQALATLLGFDSPEELIRCRTDIARQDYVDPEKRTEFRRLIDEKGIVRDFEYEAFRKDGSTIWLSECARGVRDGKGNLLYYEGTTRDITEQRKVAQALRASEEKYRAILENIEEGYYEVDLRGTFTSVNDVVVQMVNVPKEHIIGLNNRDYMDEQSAKEVYRVFHQVFQTGRSSRATDLKIMRKDGSYLWVDFSVSLIRDKEGRPAGFRGIIHDITKRKKMEDSLRAGEERFRSLYENAAIGLYRTAEDGRILLANPALVSMLGYESAEELIQRNLEEEGFEPSYPRSQFKEKARQEGEVRGLESAWKRKDGSVIFVRESARPIYGEDGSFRYYEGTAEDITEKKRAEESLKAALIEKETLLKEIHHRVKNNMQVISSLLNLQSRYAKDPETHEILQESRRRIRSIAQIHEMLYKSSNLSHIEFSGYIRSLAARQLQTLRLDPELIELKLDAEEIYFDLQAAIPCGLIVSELISNALRHAFRDGQRGGIHIGLRRGEGGEIVLSIKDNGVGLPKEIDIHNADSLGLQIVALLVDQLDGRIELERTQGTAFHIHFKEPKYKPRL